MRIKFLITIVALFSLGLTACESDEDNQIAQAQECLDALNSSGTGNAQACIDKVNGLSSSHSYVIRCNASFYIGGITTSTIVDALKDYNNASNADKEATLVTALSQTDTTRSNITYNYCKKTDIPGLVYMATLSGIGTLTSNGTGAPMDPAGIITNCMTPGNCDDAAIGQMAVTMTDLYCKGDATDSQICQDLESAIANAPTGDYETIAQNIYAYFTN